MDFLDFKKPMSVHFIGIGGISMSGLALILMNKGFKVSGSDINKTELTKELKYSGITIYYGHRAENIDESVELVVYTAAISDDNEELIAAYNHKIPVISRARLLGLIMDNYPKAVAVSGTHGKTTTTSMLAECLLANRTDPTITVGGMLDFIGGNLRIGRGEVFLTEACEYMNSFLELKPSLEIILNVEEDHLDFFKDIDDIRHSFSRFSEIARENGIVVISSAIPDYKKLLKNSKAKIVTTGRDETAEYYALDIELDENAVPSFDFYKQGECLGRINLAISGEYNVDNAVAAIAAGMELGLDFGQMEFALSVFEGTHRRFERRGEVNGIQIVDDYAHHPTEIRATINTARNTAHNELWVAFQPHTYTRTKALFDDFVKELAKADHVILADIYAAREKNTVGISSSMLAEALKKEGADAYYFSSFEEIENFALKKCKKNDMFITMGAGNIVDIANSMIEKDSC